MLACSVLKPCGPLGVGGDLSVFSGGVVTDVRVVGVPLPPTVVSVNITGFGLFIFEMLQCGVLTIRLHIGLFSTWSTWCRG